MENAREFLYDLLLQRKARNKSYSIRAFARDLNLSPAYVSQVLNKKRNLSLDQKLKIAAGLGIDFSAFKLNHNEDNSVLDLDIIEQTLEHEKILKHWYHFAILSLAQLKPLNCNSKIIAKRLGLTAGEASEAVKRLTHFGYLEKLDGKLVRSKNAFIIDSKKSSQSLRQFHFSRLMAAEQELSFYDQARIDRRFFQTLFIPSSRKKVLAAKSLITKFQNKLITHLMEDSPDEVFQLSLQLFSIEQSDSKEPKS